MHWLTIVLLVSALVAAGVASIDGLLHAAEWMVPPPLRWTLPVAVDVFLVATALATLALRKRGHLLAAALIASVTVVLVAFSAVMNWLYITSSAVPGTPQALYGPWIKAAMPLLLLAATEIVAALTTTKSRTDRSALAKSREENRRLRRELRAVSRKTKETTP